MNSKISGRRMNYRLTNDGASYRRVKKSLKNTITRAVRSKANRATKKEPQS